MNGELIELDELLYNTVFYANHSNGAVQAIRVIGLKLTCVA